MIRSRCPVANSSRSGCRDLHHEASESPHEAPKWQAAMEALILVATSGGPTMLARIGIMRALNRQVERVFDPPRKDHHWGRRKLARDR
jgi:hypothetical protein